MIADEKMNHVHQRRIFDPQMARPVTLIGAGAVGSHVALALAKLGVPKLTVWDHDFVDSHNVPMSAYRRGCDIGRRKVDALVEIVGQATGLKIDAIAERYSGEPLGGAVVSCVDTFAAREKIWRAVRDAGPFVDILVDTRIKKEFVEVFAVNPILPDDAIMFDWSLRPIKHQDQVMMCGEHGVINVSMIAAAIVCSDLTLWWRNGTTHQRIAGNVLELAFVGAPTTTNTGKPEGGQRWPRAKRKKAKNNGGRRAPAGRSPSM